MDDRTRYVAIEINVPEDVDDQYEVFDELSVHLHRNGYRFYMTAELGVDQTVLLIDENMIGYIDTILEDRDIEYRYL